MRKNNNFEIAISEINEKLKNKETNNDDLLIMHRINHKTDLEQLTTRRIFFNEKSYKRLLNIIVDACRNDYTEYGVYFYGKVLNYTLYIEGALSDFEHTDETHETGMINVSESNLEELSSLIEKTKENPNPCNLIMHFHTCPDHIRDKNGDTITLDSLLYSESDLYSYACQQMYLQPKSGNLVLFLGGLVSVNKGNPQINCVYYDPIKKNFVNIPNIYYYCDGKMHKFNNAGIAKNISIPKRNTVVTNRSAKSYKKTLIRLPKDL